MRAPVCTESSQAQGTARQSHQVVRLDLLKERLDMVNVLRDREGTDSRRVERKIPESQRSAFYLRHAQDIFSVEFKILPLPL